MWSNFHTHSSYCDGKGELNDYVHRAIQDNVICLGFSSHAPLPFDSVWCMKRERFPEYLSAIHSINIAGAPEIYKGLEVDFIPGLISPADFRPQLDFTIGSIHFVEQFPGGKRWEIDGTRDFFHEGLRDIFRHDIRAAVSRYFELTREMIQASSPEIIGHLDKIKMHNPGDQLFSEDETWYKDEVNKTLDLLADAGSILEVNTRGIYKKKTSATYPSPWVLELALEKNIPVMINSDAHHPDDLIAQFAETATLLLKIGYRTITILKEGIWKQFEFTPHGIHIN